MNRISAYILLSSLAILTHFLCFSQEKVAKQKFRLLTYGYRVITKEAAERVIAQKWGIEFYAVAGCVVSEKLVDSVAKHNKKVKQQLVSKYGKNWEGTFYKEVDSEYDRQQQVTALVNNVDFIKKHKAKFENWEVGLEYQIFPMAKSTKYKVLVQEWVKGKRKYRFVTRYKLQVDYKSKSVVSI